MNRLLLGLVLSSFFVATAVAAGVALEPAAVTVDCGRGKLKLVRAGAVWSADRVEVAFVGDGVVTLKAPETPVKRIEISFVGGYPDDRGVRVYRDAWERTYGDSGWYPLRSRDGVRSPWYTLVSHDGVTDGIGVAVQPGAFACWRVGVEDLGLVLDVRAGIDGVELGDRVLEVCRLVTRAGEKGESPFAAARAFARVMCPAGRLPKEPVYGYNDWYCAYGDNTASNFLADAAYVSECAKGLKVRPYVVMDDGWQPMSPPEIERRTGSFDSGRGPWDGSSARFGMPMPEFTARVAALGAKPGLWYRPFRAWDDSPKALLTEGDERFFDPSLSETDARVRADVGRFRGWGMKLVKIDYLAYDLVRAWGNELGELPLERAPRWRRRDRTAAEVVRSLYRAMREAAGDDMVIIGCNAFNHFAAGLFEVQRTGDDTSGRDWRRTVRMGVNTLAMRAHQDGVFFSVDADCAGLAAPGAVEWAANRQWIDLLGRSGTAVFVSWFRELATDEVRRTISAAFARSAAGRTVGEPLDWTATTRPRKWRFADGAERTYDWEAHGGDLDPLGSLLPRPVRVERLDGSCDVCSPALVKETVRAPVPGAPAATADEAYVVEVLPGKVVITAPTTRGERWARVTFDELVRLAGGDVPCCRITDWPALRWRGYMNDCGRNFLDFDAVRKIVDEMSRVKMNLFHWHLTDYHGWRLESKRYPGLQRDAAFSRHVGRYYTQREFRELVRYAADRGVTVMPELDVPGHSLALRRGLGVETMADPRVREAVAGLIEELCSLASAEAMPFVHLGTDEARQLPEYCDVGDVEHWARTVVGCGRRPVVWAPGIRLAADIGCIDMAWHDGAAADSTAPYFDAARMYNGSWNPFVVALKSAFVRPCRRTADAARQLGAVTCTWHDDYVGEDTRRLFDDAMVFPSIAAFGDSYWCGDREERPEFSGVGGHWKTPPAGSPAFLRLVELERRLAAHRDYTLAGVGVPFQFLRQTDLSWRLTGPDGALVADGVRGAAIDLDAYARRDRGTVVAETVITSAVDRVVGAWIDFTDFGSAYSRDPQGVPEVGEWNHAGAKILVNGVEVPPPVWEDAGALPTFQRAGDNEISWGNDICERPLLDEGPTRRALTPVALKRGENRVRLVMPPPELGFWGGLFAPALGTTRRPREI